MKFKSAMVTQASGSVGGMTGAHNAFGMYFRGRGIPVNPRTTRQTVVRNALAVLASRWTSVLTSTQRAIWEAYAGNVSVTTTLGDQAFVSGLSWYIGTNTLRTQLGLPIADSGPTIYTRATLTTPGVTSLTGSTGVAIVTFTNTDIWASTATGALGMWGGMPVSQGVNFYSGPYRLVGKIPGNATPPTSPQNMPAWPYPLAAGQKAFFYFRALNIVTDPRYSSQLSGSITVV